MHFLLKLLLCLSILYINMASSSSHRKQLEKGFVGGIEDEKQNPVDENVLQKHAAFFDLNKDGLIYPSETYQAMREIGSGRMLATAAAVFINGALSQVTRPGKPPSPLFPIEVKNIKLAKHGSDSGVYDSEGRFVESKFEEIFIKHAHSHPNALTQDELDEFIKSNRDPKDTHGSTGGFVEWKVLYQLAKDKNGLLQKETIRGVFDGSLFEVLKKEHSKTINSTKL
ncbi:probable peroxygenase 5 isoform X2 [Vicia villosa]|uniref:probable peroxygenase 5 isoform X2 n=2 Tax=Vicia villosa TaxID=3911 RepID=UPI00273AAF3E|nr:probable peroxygenase 5 isoform X2 [Vicia villosa]